MKNKLATEHFTEPWTWTDSLDKRRKRRNMDMRFRTWNKRSLYWPGSLMRVSRELSTYKLDRWYRTSGRIHIFCGEENGNSELGTGFFMHKRITSAVKRVEFGSDRMTLQVSCHHSESSRPNQG
jgi:hypothetical protein